MDDGSLAVKWRVRHARSSDVSAIVAMQDAIWRTEFTRWATAEVIHRDSEESARLWLARVAQGTEGTAVFVIAAESEIVGFSWTRRWTDGTDLPASTVKLNALYVDPAMQSRGAGTPAHESVTCCRSAGGVSTRCSVGHR